MNIDSKPIGRAVQAIVVAGVVLPALAYVPLVPDEMKWVKSYETIAFDTYDGDLAEGEYAVAGDGQWYVRDVPKSRGQFTSTTSVEAIRGKAVVAIRCERCAYYDEFYDGENVVRVATSDVKYDELRYSPRATQPTRKHFRSLATPAVAEAAIALDSSSSSSDTAAASSVSWSHTASGSDRVLIIGVGTRDASQATDSKVSAATYNGVAFTEIRTDFAAVTFPVNFRSYSQLWYIVAPSTGSNTISVTLTGTVDNVLGSAISFTGADQTSPVEASNGVSAGTGTSHSVSVTSTSDEAWAVDQIAVTNSGATLTVGTGQTATANIAVGASKLGMSYEGPQSPAGSITMSWTTSSSVGRSLTAAVIKPSTGAPPAADSGSTDVVFFE